MEKVTLHPIFYRIATNQIETENFGNFATWSTRFAWVTKK